MAFVVTDSCTKDCKCVDVCPVDCIHPRKDSPDFESAPTMFIHPDECIDCGACIPVCETQAIYDSIDSVPASQRDLIEANSAWYTDKARAIAIFEKHVADHPELMALDPSARQASH